MPTVNSLITPQIIAKEALFQLSNSMIFAKACYKEYRKEFVKVGDTVSIRKPVKFVSNSGNVLIPQNVQESNTSITISNQENIGWGFSSKDLTLTIEDYSERYITPAVQTLANAVDRSIAGLFTGFWNYSGSPGITPSNFAAVSQCAQRMDEMAVPSNDRRLVTNPAAAYAIAGTATNIYNPNSAKAYSEGSIGRIAALDTYQTQNIPVLLTGQRGGVPVVAAGPPQNVTYAIAKVGINGNSSTLVISGAAASVINWANAGEVINIGGVYAMNPVPGNFAAGKLQMPYLQDFTILQSVNSTAGGTVTLTVSPAIISPDGTMDTAPYVTVSQAPAAGAPILFRSGGPNSIYPQNLYFHKNAIALVTVPVEMPDGVAFKARESADGLSIRVVKQFDIIQDQDVIRLDILWGEKLIYPDLGGRLSG